MKIEVVTKITTTFVVTDTGYTSGMNLEEIDKWAKQKLRTVTIYLKEGSTEPKPVQAKFEIEQIKFTPDKDE